MRRDSAAIVLMGEPNYGFCPASIVLIYYLSGETQYLTALLYSAV